MNRLNKFGLLLFLTGAFINIQDLIIYNGVWDDIPFLSNLSSMLCVFVGAFTFIHESRFKNNKEVKHGRNK